MKTAMFRMFQMCFAIFLLAIAFWPGWGLAYTAFRNVAEHPNLVIVCGAIWTLLMALNLPLTRRQFQYAGALCFLAMIGALLFHLYNTGRFDATSQDQWIITAIIVVGFLLGWFTISSYVWRSYRGVLGVDDAETGPDGE